MPVLKLAVNSADHHLGNINAPVTLIEYGDFQCPYCRRAYPLVKRLIRERSNEICIVFRNFPLKKIHPMAFSAALAAEAGAKQNKFWEMHDLIFENQPKLSAHFLIGLASEIGLDRLQFEEDMKLEEIRLKIENDFQSGIQHGVNKTPGFFVNGSLLSTYDETYKSLIDAIQIESEIRNG